MLDLTKRWPLGLDRRNVWQFALGVIALLAIVFWFDSATSFYVRSWPEPVLAFFATITELGLSDWILYPSLAFTLLCAGLALVMRKRTPKLALVQMAQLYGFIFVGVGLPGLVANLFKRLIGRGRPEMFEQFGMFHVTPVVNDFTFQSFPSGHTTTAFALAMVVAFLSARWLWPMLAVAAAVGLSRIAVGAHYPTDVIGGVVVGVLGAYAVRNFFAARRWLFRVTPSGAVRMRPQAAVQRLIRGRKKRQPR